MSFPAESDPLLPSLTAPPHPQLKTHQQKHKIFYTIVEYVQLLEETILSKCKHLIGIQKGLFKNV